MASAWEVLFTNNMNNLLHKWVKNTSMNKSFLDVVIKCIHIRILNEFNNYKNKFVMQLYITNKIILI